MAYIAPRTWVAGLEITADIFTVDFVENFTAAFPTDAVWRDWDVTFTNFTLDNGTVDYARYFQVGKTVIAQVQVTWGSGSSASGHIFIGLPVTIASGYPVSDESWQAVFSDSGFDVYYGRAEPSTDRQSAALIAEDVSGTYTTTTIVNATVPFTWTTSDKMSFQAIYEAE